MHPHRTESSGHKRADHLLKGYKHGGAVKEDMRQNMETKAPAAEMGPDELKSGGKVHGKKAHARMDKRARGGAVKKKPSAVVNVMIGHPSAGAGPMAAPMVPPAGLGAPPVGGPPMPPPGMGAGPGAGMPPLPPGAPMMRKHGGRVMKHTGEAEKRTEKMRREASNKKGYRSGGRVKSYPNMEAGSLTGEGRLEKVRKYGANARP